MLLEMIEKLVDYGIPFAVKDGCIVLAPEDLAALVFETAETVITYKDIESKWEKNNG